MYYTYVDMYGATIRSCPFGPGMAALFSSAPSSRLELEDTLDSPRE
jgi:hypothetical protein